MKSEAQEMDDMAKITPRRALALLAGLMFVIYLVLSHYDDTTVLLPDRSRVLTACFLLGGLGALAAFGIVIYHWRRLVTAQRVVWPFAAALLGFLTVFVVSSTVSDLIWNRIDFPASRTRTETGYLAISRAYQTHGKNQGWHIQTKPLWADMTIVKSDYEFMLAHRPKEQTDADEIGSGGLFCAHVTMQRTETALRVLHAGQGTLPSGTVVLCPGE